MRDQMRAHLGWIEAQLGDGRKWLLGDFSLADVSAYMNFWYVRSNLLAEEDQAVAGIERLGWAGLFNSCRQLKASARRPPVSCQSHGGELAHALAPRLSIR